tara:strand:+ start:826 stop:1341 length:516 start_codon:yes stop_codon:yes gene_type:complete
MNILSFDTIDIIFDYLDPKLKYYFTLLNHLFYEHFNIKIQKYKLLNYINKDYLNFYKTLNENNYTTDIQFIDKVIAKTFMNIPTIRPSKVVEMYDLRFVFELIFNGYCPNDSDIKLYNVHFYIHFYQRIKQCIVNNRQVTINNIEKDSYLFSLKQNSKFKDDSNWISIYKE